MDTLKDLIQAVDEVFFCYKCGKTLYGESSKGQLAEVNYTNNEMFVFKENAYLFCDKHIKRGIEAWRESNKK